MAMRCFVHRVNTLPELSEIPYQYGVEIDLRSNTSGEIILQHEPFQSGCLFSDWLSGYNHSGLILNVKEVGLETAVLRLLNDRGIHDFFFLDQPLPSIVSLTKMGEHRLAVRVSEYESVASALALARHVEWVWVDFFHAPWITYEDVLAISNAGLRVCFVSPELQSHPTPIMINQIKQLFDSYAWKPEAVCTKIPQAWGFD